MSQDRLFLTLPTGAPRALFLTTALSAFASSAGARQPPSVAQSGSSSETSPKAGQAPSASESSERSASAKDQEVAGDEETPELAPGEGAAGEKSAAEPPKDEEAPGKESAVESSDTAEEGKSDPVDESGDATPDPEPSPESDEDGWRKLEAQNADPVENPPKSKSYFRTMLLLEGTARYGVVTIAAPGTSLEEDDPNTFESRVGNLGGQATLGVMPSGSVFTMAGRLRGGSYLSHDFTRGNMAAEMLFGANFGRSARGNEFTHILGGFGVEFLPGENQDLLTLSAAAGTIVKGVSFGGGFTLGANDEIAIGTLGMQIGWGQLF